MYNIRIVFTRQYECGNCNSYELYRIIESVKPEIIFEELSLSNYLMAYRHEKLVTLETSSIKMYLLNYPIKHIPVDTFERPKLYEEDCDYMLDRITSDGG